MSFAGKLEEFPLTQLLQVIAASGETGKLRLTRHDREGIIVFRNGNIVYAATSSARQTLGNLLLLENLVTDEQLTAALELQHEAGDEKRLGGLLLELEAIDQQTLERIVQDQTERVISEFMRWTDGYFKLHQVEITDFGEIEVDAKEFLMREGLETDVVLTDLESKLEQHHVADDREAIAGSETAQPQALATLKSLMGEIRSPEFTGEITQTILSFAQELFSRGVIFVVRQDGFGVMGQFGIESTDGQAEARLRQVVIPLTEPSILSETADRKEAVLAELDDSECNQMLVEAIGGPAEGPVVSVPLTVNNKVLLVLSGDSLYSDLRSGWLEELDLLMLQAGLAMEKDLLSKRIEHYENLRRES